MLSYMDLPPELRRLLDEAVRELHGVRMHIRNTNYGLADDQLEATIERLPVDTGQGGSVWMALEQATS